MRRAERTLLGVLLIIGVGCGGGDGSGKGSPGPDATSAPSASASPTPTPIAPANAWSVGDRSHAGGPDTPGRIEGIVVRSTDGGAHWTETLTVEGASFADVSFADASRGWVVGYGQGSGAILRSDDGGVAWVSQRATVPVELFDLTAAQALTRDLVVAVGGGAPIPGTGDAPALILRTVDAGATWTVVPIPANGGGDPTRTRLAGVCITPTGAGIAVGSGMSTRLVVRTSDFGASWVDITARAAGSSVAELFDVACYEDELWITTNGGTFVRYSGDGGITWRDVLPITLDTAIGGIAAPSRGVAVAVGVDDAGQPLILRTEDRGGSWARESIDGFAREGCLADIALGGADDALAVGEAGCLVLAQPPPGSLTLIGDSRQDAWNAGAPISGYVRLRGVDRIP